MSVTESKNHRMVKVVRDFWRSSGSLRIWPRGIFVEKLYQNLGVPANNNIWKESFVVAPQSWQVVSGLVRKHNCHFVSVPNWNRSSVRIQ